MIYWIDFNQRDHFLDFSYTVGVNILFLSKLKISIDRNIFFFFNRYQQRSGEVYLKR